MLNYSTRFKELIKSDVRNILYELNITLANGNTLLIDNSKLWGDSLTLEDGTSESEQFTVGSAIASRLKFGINNIYGDYNDISFDRATIVLKIGLDKADYLATNSREELQTSNRESIGVGKEMVQVGKFIVDSADYDSSIISIIALDNFIKMDSVVSALSFPIDTRTLVQNICSSCGVTNIADSFLANHNYTIKAFDYANMTYRTLLMYLCQYMGCFAKMDSQGRLELKWYQDIFDEEEHENIEVIDSFKSINLSTDNIVISGVEVVLDDEHKYSIGTSNYVVSISNNPIIVDEEMAQSLMNRLYVQIGGYTFKKCNADTLLYLWFESGDVCYVQHKNVKYPIFISNRTLNSNGGMTISCDAETPLRNSSVQNDSSASAIRQLRQDLKKEKDDRARVEEELREEIAGAGGIYETEVDGSEGEGGKIKYLHNKPLLSDSAIQWKFTASTISVSKDYGETWSFALNSDGQAILNQIYALGINADYVQTGYIKGLNKFKVEVYKTKTDGTYSGLTNTLTLSSTSSDGCLLNNHNDNLNYNLSNQLWLRANTTSEMTNLGNILKKQSSNSSQYINYLYMTTNTVDRSSGSTYLYNKRYNDNTDNFANANYFGLSNGVDASGNKKSSITLFNYINSNDGYGANSAHLCSDNSSNYITFFNRGENNTVINDLSMRYDRLQTEEYSSNGIAFTNRRANGNIANLIGASAGNNKSNNYVYIRNYDSNGNMATWLEFQTTANKEFTLFNGGYSSNATHNKIGGGIYSSYSSMTIENAYSGAKTNNIVMYTSPNGGEYITISNTDSSLNLGPNGNANLYAWNSVTLQSLNYYCIIRPYSSNGDNAYYFAKDGIYFGSSPETMRKVLSV